MLIRIILVVQDPVLRKRFQSALARPDILIQVPRSRHDLWERIICEPADVLIFGQSFLPNTLKASLDELAHQPNSPATVVLSDKADPKDHARLLAAGCDAVLFAGLAVEQVRDVIEVMLEKRRRLTQRRFFSPQPLAEPRLADFVSRSPSMAEFMNVVPRVVQSDSSLLIEGETGVGKERLACAIHSEGPRSAGRFVALNCGALPEHLLESELFGHVRGAFTGATTSRRGWFAIADRGTLFLDEVGEIPLHLQVKLLRVLQEQEILPIGSEKSFGVDVRIIAASNRPLKLEVEAGRFRRDLFHRLSVVSVTVPPLRERPEDIPELVERQIHFLAQQMSRRVKAISAQAMNALCRYPWPGNLRELSNVLERAILLCDDSEIAIDDLPESISGMVFAPTALPVSAPSTAGAEASSEEGWDPAAAERLRLPEQWLTRSLHTMRRMLLSDLERQYIKGLLRATCGRIGEAAKRAGLQERSLYEKMKEFALSKEDFRRLSHPTPPPPSDTVSSGVGGQARGPNKARPPSARIQRT